MNHASEHIASTEELVALITTNQNSRSAFAFNLNESVIGCTGVGGGKQKERIKRSGRRGDMNDTGELKFADNVFRQLEQWVDGVS